MKKYVRKAILLTITLLLVGASPVQMVAAVAVEQSNLKSATHDKTKTAALLDKVFKMPKRQSEVNTSADTDKAPVEVQPEPKVDPVPEPDKPDVAQKEKISEPTPTLAPQLKATEPITGNYGASSYTLDPDTGVLEFGAGTLAAGAIYNSDEFRPHVSLIKEIKFSSGATLPQNCGSMFEKLSSLEKFDSENLDTSNVTIMRNMFYDSAATTLDLSHFNTSAVTDMYYMFAFSKALALDLSDFNTSAVTNMSYMFSGSAATTLDLSYFNTSAVTNMRGMFSNSAATTLDLSYFNTSAVTDMTSMFSGSKATTLDLSHFKTIAVTDMSFMFQNSAATTLDLSDFDTSHVIDMRYMFAYSKATTLALSDFDTRAVTDMSYMFNNSAATTLDLSDFDTSHVIDMRYMFAYSKATTLDLSYFDTSAVTNMSYMFYYSPATMIDVSSFKTSAVTNMQYMFYQANVQTLDLSHFTFNPECDVAQMLYTTRGDLWRLILGANQTFDASASIQNPMGGSTIPGADSNYVSGKRWQIVGNGTDHEPTGAKISGADISKDSREVTTTYVWEHIEKWHGVNGNSPWYLNPNDGVLTFYKSEDSSPTALAEPVSENLTNTFGYTSDLPQSVTAIRFQDAIAAPVNSSNLFAGLESLTLFDSKNLDTSNVVNMKGMFEGLYSLLTLNIGDFNTNKVMDMSYMFAESSLNSLDLSHFNTSKVENMEFMFLSTPYLMTLNLSNFNTSNVKNMSAMFAMNGVKHLNLSHFNTARVENMQFMFLGSFVETLDISSFNLSGLDVTSPVLYMFSSLQSLDPGYEQGSNLWQVKLGAQTVFPDDPGFEAAPADGTTIPGTNYVTNDAEWQIVGNGSIFNPKGGKVTTTQMWDNAPRPVTYVWANKNQSPSIVSVDSLNFGELSLANPTLTPSATNMTTGNLKLGDLAGAYQVTVSQADNWVIDDETTISSNDLPIKYGGKSLASGATPFVAGDEMIAEKDIKFNHDSSKQFILDLRGNANLQAVLGKSLTTTLTWTLSDTPES